MGRALRACGGGRRARRRRGLNGATHGAHALSIERARSSRRAERAAESQVIRPERNERRNVLDPQRTREPAHESRRACVPHEGGELPVVDVIAQRPAPLVRRVEHDSGAGVGHFHSAPQLRRQSIREVHRDDPQRPRFHCRVVHAETHAPFRGFNRAQAAVIEAAILVSRLGMLPAEKVDRAVEYLKIAIDKTAGPRERQAWEWLMQRIAEHRSGGEASR